jgi:hypothetical protein
MTEPRDPTGNRARRKENGRADELSVDLCWDFVETELDA